MLTNAKVGTKLLALIIAPVMVLLAVASLGARDRLADAAQAQTAEQAAALTASTDALIRALSDERLLTTAATANDAAVDVEDARATTDAAIEAVRPTLAASSVPGLGQDRREQVTGQLDDLEALRRTIDSDDATVESVISGYTQVIDEIILLESEIAASTSAAELSLALADAAVLSRAQEARGEFAALGAAAIGEDDFAIAGLETLTDLRDEEARLFARFSDGANSGSITALRDAMATPEAVGADGQVETMISNATIGGPGRPEVALDDWIDGQQGWFETIGEVDRGLLGSVIDRAADQAFEETKAARLFMIATAGATLLSVLLAIWVARSIDRPLRKLTDAANELATDRLPRLVENLRSPEATDAEIAPFEAMPVTSSDEIGQMTEAFNAIQQVTMTVAEEQSTLLRKGIGDIFVNLARRNQSLLDRQIEFIDDLESKEQDPDLLENLFRLDHLATRMRRNAESLLVLAGAEPARRRAKPVALGDVLRVALGEVEDFTRIELREVDDAIVAGNLAVDLSHLLSELMENATHFSPPETKVEVAGQFGPAGAFVLSVADQGIGMSGEQLAEANALLEKPPLVGLALGRSLGFIVVGRIAARLGLRVHLNASPAGGVTAVVSMPSDLVARPGEEEPRDPVLDRGPTAPASMPAASTPEAARVFEPPSSAASPPVDASTIAGEDEWAPGATIERPGTPVLDAATSPSAAPEPGLPRPTTPSGEPPPLPSRSPAASTDPDHLSEALPEGDDFEAGLASLVGPESSEEDVEHQFWGALADEDRPATRPDRAAAPAPTEQTADLPTRDAGPAGLTRRVPGAAAEPPTFSGPPVNAPKRSPEEVRAMLSRYRDGKKAPPDSGSADGSTTEDNR